MADRPILFSGPMVRALLADEKTNTRRVLVPQPDVNGPGDKVLSVRLMHIEGELVPRVAVGSVLTEQRAPCAIGDRLWVRESVACGACAPSKPSLWAPSFWRREQGSVKNPNGIWYQADGLEPERPITDRGKWVPSIFMPRWCSRISCIVTDVRIERVQAITDDDALNEGVSVAVPARAGQDIDIDGQYWPGGPRRMFKELWNGLNEKRGYGWDANPKVFVIVFKTLLKNIDRLES